ncbi:flagellar basal-body MS-ring/collar protein FliF [Polymorphobacter megasporae]|uniref:flagellar basal-body MS-ring/collar protein FliF n=1 Tax=Glacieibacterium megasporae TaxID=2835787 RepID=UPI001C1DE9E8|nr:flagellar basal-body MS-ring/collar protein FliF [Polymorphobacter megasporae]UAJ09617.1 flagellar M-ring protein FliF [Polymorphobacter megasporae]
MSDLAVLDPRAMTSFAGLRLRGQRLFAQPAIRRSLPALAVLLALVVTAGLWLALRAPDYRPVFAQLGEADKAAVLAALQTGNFKAHVDPDTGSVEVPAGDVAAARIMLAGQGLPKAAVSGLDVLGTMPLGSSRAVETARLKSAAESDLAASIMAIDGVDHATVHLAAGEQSVFIRDAAAPTASVFVRLASGRSLNDAQVRAIVHLIASSVAGLSPDRVSVVDQSGTLLSGDASGPLGDSARQLAYQSSVEDGLRRRVVALLTPILGAGNFSTQVATDLDFSVNEATRESYDKDGVLRSDQNSSATEAGQQPARGIPGALSNTVPPAAQVSVTPPIPALPAVVPGTHSESYIRGYEIGKAVSVTRAPVGAVRRVSVAVVVRDSSLGAAKEQAAQVALLTGLVRSAVGYDARRGDVVTVAGRAFVATPGEAVVKWWEIPLVATGVEAVTALGGVALLVFGVVRPAVRVPVPGSEDEPQRFEDAPEIIELDPLDYAIKLAETRLRVGQDVDRASAVVRQMMAADTE